MASGFAHLDLQSRLDHLVVTAGTLAIGASYLTESLGFAPSGGGEHARMGTHNALVKLDDSAYIEAIAANPAAASPAHPRWFGLGHEDASVPARLATWVVRTNDIRRALALVPVALGRPEHMDRGAYRWQISVPDDGQMPLGGAVPSLIEWASPVHPAATLPESHCRLICLRIRHAQAELIAMTLRVIGFAGPVSLAKPSGLEPEGLQASIQTPRGIIELH